MVNLKGKSSLIILSILFSLVSAFFLWNVLVTNEPPVKVQTNAQWITSPVKTNLCYFKKDYYIGTPVKQAWIVYQAHDNIAVSINGKSAVTDEMQGAVVKGVSDISKFLAAGENKVIIEAKNKLFEGTPEVLVEIGYLDHNNKIHILLTDGSWDVNAYNYDRRKLQVDSGQVYWQKAQVIDRQTDFLFSNNTDVYSTPPTRGFLYDPDTRFRFSLNQKPGYAWLRVGVPGNYKVYVNSNILEEQEFSDPSKPDTTKKITIHRIDRFLRSGTNEIRVLLSAQFVGKIGIFLDGAAYDGNRIVAINDSLSSPQTGIQIPSGEQVFEMVLAEKAPFTFIEILSYIALFLIILFACLTIAGLSQDHDSLIAYFAMSMGLFVFFIGLNYDCRLFLGYGYNLSFVLTSLAVPLVLVKASRTIFLEGNLKYEKAMLFIVTVFGFLIRMVYFNEETFHADEAALVLKAQGVFDYYYPSLKISDSMPAFYVTTSELLSYIQALSIKILGVSENAIRLQGLIAGTLSIPLIYGLANTISSKRVALLSALVFAFLPTSIGMPSFGRYPLLLLMMALCSAYFLHIYFVRDKKRYLVLSALFFLLSYFSWQGSGFFLLPLTLNIIYVRKSKFLRDIVLFLGIILPVVSFHLLYRFYLVTTIDAIIYGSSVATIAPTIGFWQPYFAPFYYWKNFLMVNHHIFLFMLFCLSLGLQCYYFLTKRPLSDSLFFMQIYLLSTTFCMSFLLEIYSYRYSFYLLPFFIICACIALDIVSGLCAKYSRHVFIFLSSLLFLLSTDFVLQIKNFPYTTTAIKSNYDVISFSRLAKVVPSLKYHLAPNDIVLHVQSHLPKVYQVKHDLYLQTILLLPFVTPPLDSAPLHRVAGDKSVVTSQELQKATASGHRVWVIMSPMIEGSIANVDTAYIKSHYKLFYDDINTQIYSSY